MNQWSKNVDLTSWSLRDVKVSRDQWQGVLERAREILADHDLIISLDENPEGE